MQTYNQLQSSGLKIFRSYRLLIPSQNLCEVVEFKVCGVIYTANHVAKCHFRSQVAGLYSVNFAVVSFFRVKQLVLLCVVVIFMKASLELFPQRLDQFNYILTS